MEVIHSLILISPLEMVTSSQSYSILLMAFIHVILVLSKQSLSPHYQGNGICWLARRCPQRHGMHILCITESLALSDTS